MAAKRKPIASSFALVEAVKRSGREPYSARLAREAEQETARLNRAAYDAYAVACLQSWTHRVVR